MTPLTEQLDRIAQSHIEGRVERVRPAPLVKFPWYAGRMRGSSVHRCVHCGAEFDSLEGYYPHRYGCPCVHPMQGTTK